MIEGKLEYSTIAVNYHFNKLNVQDGRKWSDTFAQGGNELI